MLKNGKYGKPRNPVSEVDVLALLFARSVLDHLLQFKQSNFLSVPIKWFISKDAPDGLLLHVGCGVRDHIECPRDGL